MRTAALVMIAACTLALAGCGSCNSAPAELDRPETGSAGRSASGSPADGPLVVLDGSVNARGPVDKSDAQKIAMRYADTHWRRYHPEQTSVLWVERNGNFHVLVEFPGRKVVATVIVRPGDGSIDDAGIYVPDGG